MVERPSDFDFTAKLEGQLASGQTVITVAGADVSPEHAALYLRMRERAKRDRSRSRSPSTSPTQPTRQAGASPNRPTAGPKTEAELCSKILELEAELDTERERSAQSALEADTARAELVQVEQAREALHVGLQECKKDAIEQCRQVLVEANNHAVELLESTRAQMEENAATAKRYEDQMARMRAELAQVFSVLQTAEEDLQ